MDWECKPSQNTAHKSNDQRMNTKNKKREQIHNEMETLQFMQTQPSRLCAFPDIYIQLDYRYFVQSTGSYLLCSQVHLHFIITNTTIWFTPLHCTKSKGVKITNLVHMDSIKFLPEFFFFRLPYFSAVKICAFRLKFFERCSLHIIFNCSVAPIVRSTNNATCKMNVILVLES